jgi:hypothetical protein
VFVASHHDSAGNQEFFLFSWKLLLCDLILAIYLFFISLFILLLGADLTTNVVVNTLCRCGPDPEHNQSLWSQGMTWKLPLPLTHLILT